MRTNSGAKNIIQKKLKGFNSTFTFYAYKLILIFYYILRDGNLNESRHALIEYII